jgi:hypothetical protein
MADHSPAFVRPLLVLAAALTVLAFAALTGASPAQAASCSQSRLPNGNGYITSLNVTRVSCRTGRNVALAYYRCRIRKGKTARCNGRVAGYRCRETKRMRIATELNARVSCTRGARRVVHTYQQFL